jgi:exodeoxyribonuclease VII small subunit
LTRNPTSRKEESFESSLKRLQQIVDALEGGSVDLEDVMKMYEEGVRLSRKCLDQLQQVEVKLKRLGKEVNGSFKLSDQTLEE